MESLFLVALILLVVVPGGWCIWGNIFVGSNKDTSSDRLLASMSLLSMLCGFILTSLYL